jgi:hypothetical protein
LTPYQRQTDPSQTGVPPACAAANLSIKALRPSKVGALARTRWYLNEKLKTSQGTCERNLDVTPNGPCEPATSAIPRSSGLGGNTHLLDALELLPPLNGTSANLISATSARQRRSQRHAERSGPTGARRGAQAPSPGREVRGQHSESAPTAGVRHILLTRFGQKVTEIILHKKVRN